MNTKVLITMKYNTAVNYVRNFSFSTSTHDILGAKMRKKTRVDPYCQLGESGQTSDRGSEGN
jgi:hypothetical protein